MFSFRFFVRIVVSPGSPPFCKPKQVYHTDTGSRRSHLFLRVCSENVVVGAWSRHLFGIVVFRGEVSIIRFWGTRLNAAVNFCYKKSSKTWGWWWTRSLKKVVVKLIGKLVWNRRARFGGPRQTRDVRKWMLRIVASKSHCQSSF